MSRVWGGSIVIAKKDLGRAVKLLKIFIEQYIIAAFYFSYSRADFESQSSKGLKKDFSFQHFAEIFETNHLLAEGIQYSKVEVFFRKQDSLKKAVENALFRIELYYFPELSDLLEDYLRELVSNNPKESVLS